MWCWHLLCPLNISKIIYIISRWKVHDVSCSLLPEVLIMAKWLCWLIKDKWEWCVSLPSVVFLESVHNVSFPWPSYLQKHSMKWNFYWIETLTIMNRAPLCTGHIARVKKKNNVLILTHWGVWLFVRAG